MISLLLVLHVPNQTELSLQRWYFRWWIDPGTPYADLRGEVSFERVTFFRLQVYKKVETTRVEVFMMG